MSVAGAILTLGFGTFTDVNHIVTLGYETTGTPPPPPQPPVTGGSQSGADSQSTRDWRWYEDQEIRPSWYEYPPEPEALQKEIAKVAKRKKKLERRLSFAKGPADLQKMMDRLAKLQETLSKLVLALQAQEAEESEFIDLLWEIL